MNLLVKAVLLRTLGFLLWVSLSAWLFVVVEYKEADEKEEKYQLLLSLYEFLASKYNMSIEEFNNISNSAYEALSQPKIQWTYSNAMAFVFQSLTTIGKPKYTISCRIRLYKVVHEVFLQFFPEVNWVSHAYWPTTPLCRVSLALIFSWHKANFNWVKLDSLSEKRKNNDDNSKL